MNELQTTFKHAPSISNKTLLDLAIVLATLIGSYILSAYFNWSEKYVAWSALHEQDFNIDELPIALLATLSAMAWFSARRHIEIQNLLAINHQLLHHANHMQEEERRRIAQDLHDDLGQYLNAIRIESTNIMQMADSASIIKSTAERIISHSDHAYATAKTLIYRLRPVALDDLGLSAALNHLLSTWDTPANRTSLDLRIDGDIDDLNEELSIDVYRIVQECLTNAARHAFATNVHVNIKMLANSLVLTVVDDGCGFHANQATQGFGLAGMRERVESHHGQLLIDSKPDTGTKISIQIPISSINLKSDQDE